MKLPAGTQCKIDLLSLLRSLPPGRVATIDAIAAELRVLPMVIATVLANLTTDERELVPWHRVVAKGGAIGRGPNREEQFARLMREGVPVSPAGIVQDMTRFALLTFGTSSFTRPAQALHSEAVPASRSRGIKDRPGH